MAQRPVLVLMPGLDGTGKLFAPIVPLLEMHFKLVFVTYPDLGSFTEYVERAQKQLPNTPGFSLLAESFSGPVAMALLAHHGDQIGPSVLCTTFARSPLASLTRMAAHVPDQMFSIGALNQFCMDVYEVGDEDPSQTQPLPLNVTEQLDGALLKNRVSVLSRIDVSALLPQIVSPILLLHGTHDRIIAEHDAQLIERNLERVERVDLDGPHLLLQTRPEQCARLILRHLRAGS